MTEVDFQSHVLQYTVLEKHASSLQSTDIHYNLIYGSLEDQVPMTTLSSSLLEVQNRLIVEGT